MKKIILTTGILLMFSASIVMAQNVGINTTGAAPDAGAGLDVNFNNKGVLIPRVNIANLNTIAPIVGSATVSMLVYNTNATTGVGYHYWDGTSWVRLATNGEAWLTTGNAGTNIANNFVGTTDNVGLRIRTNNFERFEITGGTLAGGGRLRAINTGSAALPTYSWSDNANMGIYRIGNQILGLSTTGAERMRIVGSGRVAINSPVANPSGQLEILGNFVAGVGNDGTVVTRNTNNGGIAIGAAGQNQTWNGIAGGSAGAFVGNNLSISTFFTSGGVAEAIYAQDAFGANWRVGHWTGGAYRKILGTGTVSTIVKDTNDNYVVMNCPETPENLFFDYGIGKLENGKVYIKIDPNLSKNILVDEEHPLKIFIQLEGECNGVYVTNKSADGFEVIELNSGNSNVEFSYKIVATMGYQTTTSPEGHSRTADYSKRWEKAPDLLPTTNPIIPNNLRE